MRRNFPGMKSSTTWLGNVIAQSPRKFRDISNTYNIRFIMVYRMIIDVILHLFIIFNDPWCQLPFLKKSFCHNGSAVFGKMPQMCRGCPDVNKHQGMDAAIWGQHRPFMSIRSFVQHSMWQEMVSLCSLIRLIGMCADRDQPEFLCSCSDSRVSRSPCGHSGRLLTLYRQREVRNSIYWYKKIHIDYRSKFSYQFYIVYIDNWRQHYFYATSIFMYHFIAICVQTRDTFRKHPIWVEFFFSCVTLKFHRWPWKSIGYHS